MCRFSKPVTALMVLTALVASASSLAGGRYDNIGRPATNAEIKAWDIDVRADFKGLPPGRGDVETGQNLFEAKCASCHGSFGESNEVFTPLVGGVTADDIKTGRVKSLATGSSPQRTTFMKVATLSTLFDYIQRAMPWTEPKSLKPNDVYAILAYLLNLSEIVPADFVLDQDNIKSVQQKMPNRFGMTTKHAMWPTLALGGVKTPDTRNVACMKNCKTHVEQVSELPEYAWNAHGNLADQGREVGEIRYKTTDPNAAKKPGSKPLPHPVYKLAQSSACIACHGLTNKLVGPGFTDVAKKYQGAADAPAKLLAKLKQGGAGSWGDVPMPPQAHLKEDDLKKLIEWILSGAPAQTP